MSRPRLLSLCGLIVVTAISLLVLQRRATEPDLDQIRVATVSDLEREIESLRERLGIPGLSAAIGERGHIIWARGFGWADVERHQSVQPDNIFHLASLTKPYAASLALQLVDEGQLDLDAMVRFCLMAVGDDGNVLVSPSAKLFLSWFSNRQMC
jgi:CubicO group peptidase (beta-lactamase class C family)